MLNVQPGPRTRTLTGSCSSAGTSQPDSTLTLQRHTQAYTAMSLWKMLEYTVDTIYYPTKWYETVALGNDMEMMFREKWLWKVAREKRKVLTWTAAVLLMIDRSVKGSCQRGLALRTGSHTPWPPLIAQLLLSPPFGSSIWEPHLHHCHTCNELQCKENHHTQNWNHTKSLPVSWPLVDQSCLPISPLQRHLGNVSFQTLWKILTNVKHTVWVLMRCDRTTGKLPAT